MFVFPLMLRLVITLTALFLLVATVSFGENITLMHDSSPEYYIQVTRDRTQVVHTFSFAFCAVKETPVCTQMGRYKLYREEHLRRLEHSYRTTAYLVFGTEMISLTIFLTTLLYYVYKEPYVAESLQKASAGGEESMTFASPSAQPEMARRAFRMPAPESMPRIMGAAASNMGRLYKDYIRPTIYFSLFSLRDKFVEIVHTLSTLAVQFLSPSGHFRAASLMLDILESDGDLSFTNRTHASLSEYARQYHLSNIHELKTRIEDFLAAY